MTKRTRASFNPSTWIDEGMTLEEAEERRHADNPENFHLALLSEKEIMGMRVPSRSFIAENLIVEKSITLVNGFRGHGKTWFVEALANEATWGGSIGPWKILTPVNTLLIDGEMPLGEVQERLRRMNVDRDITRKPAHLFVYPESYAYRIGLNRANLLEDKWRNQITDMVKANGVILIILDNLASLAPGIDENDKMQFDPINRWMLELRFGGCSIIMTHHVGKSGQQRGTTSHEDHVDLALLLARPKGYTAENGCKFVCQVTKDRAHATKGEEYTLELTEMENGRVELTTAELTGRALARLRLSDNPELTLREAREMGIGRTVYFDVKKEMGL